MVFYFNIMLKTELYVKHVIDQMAFLTFQTMPAIKGSVIKKEHNLKKEFQKR
ncbi:MAG: hypothetical protein ACJA1Z_004000 [Patiriisocius sp.]|jgi:hypothetical protein